MSRLTKIIQVLCIFVVLAFVGVSLQSKVQAQGGCHIETYKVCDLDPESMNYGDCETQYYDGCGDNWDYCPPNFYRAPDGSCRENGASVASVACGEFYACPTANNPVEQSQFNVGV